MIECTPKRLYRMLLELDPKRQIQALKGASQRAANKVRKKAVENLKKAEINSNRDLEKGIRKVVNKKNPGFRVTIGSKAKKKRYLGKRKGIRRYAPNARTVWTDFSHHTNRQGKKKPVLIWAEGGTKARKTRTETKFFVRKRKGHSTGRMKAYRFMKKTDKEMKDRITADYRKAVEESITKTVKKYGKS